MDKEDQQANILCVCVCVCVCVFSFQTLTRMTSRISRLAPCSRGFGYVPIRCPVSLFRYPRAFLTKRLAHQQAATPPVHTGLDINRCVDATSEIGPSAPGEFECIQVGTFESILEGDLSSDADEAGDQDGPGCSKSASMSKFEAERRRLERQRNDEIAAKNVERKRMEELIVLLTKVGAVDSIPPSLIQKVLSEKDPKGFHHYLLAQALLTHLKYHHCDTAPLLDIDWQDTLLSHFGPSVVDKQIVLPPPPPKAHVVAQEQRTLFHNQDPKQESLPLFAPGLSSFSSEIFAGASPQSLATLPDPPPCEKPGSRDEREHRGQTFEEGGGSRLEMPEQALELRDAYGASVLHIASLYGYHSVLHQVRQGLHVSACQALLHAQSSSTSFTLLSTNQTICFRQQQQKPD